MIFIQVNRSANMTQSHQSAAGNRYHVTMRIHSPDILFSNRILWFSGLRCVQLRETYFLFEELVDWFVRDVFVETSYLNTDTCKTESSKIRESRIQSVDSSKAYGKPRAFILKSWIFAQGRSYGGHSGACPANVFVPLEIVLRQEKFVLNI